MAREPTLNSLLTRIEHLERHVERLERAATVTRRKPARTLTCPHGVIGRCERCFEMLARGV